GKRGLGELGGVGQVEERGQQLPRLDGSGRSELRHRQHRLVRAARLALIEREVGERAVRGAEVDAERGAGLLGHGSSTSAGARIFGSSAAGGAGSFTSRAAQPWCFSAPLNGGLPATLPVRRMRWLSKPAGTSTVAPSSCASTGSMS